MNQQTLPPQRVVFFGDSRADWWIPPTIPGVQWLNRGVPGASAGYLLQRFTALVAPLRPDRVVVQMGVNDLVELTMGHHGRAQIVAMTGRTIAAVVANARDLGARVVLTTIFPLAHGAVPDVAVQRAIAEVNRDLLGRAMEGVAVLDSAAVLVGPDGYVRDVYAADELHLSAAGYAALNVALVPLLGEGTRASLPRRGSDGLGQS